MAYQESLPGKKSQTEASKSKRAIVADLKQRFLNLSKALNDVFDEIENLNRPSSAPPSDRTRVAVARLRSVVTARKRRNQAFPNHHFADPAWDMILDLTIAMAENRRISVSSLSFAANVPTTTALRCIKQLAEEGTIVIVSDPKDSRRKHTQLSEDVFDRMISFALQSHDKK